MLKKFLNYLSVIIIVIGFLMGAYLIFNRQYSNHARYYKNCSAGLTALNQGDVEQAKESFLTGISIDDTKGTAWVGLLRSYEKTEDVSGLISSLLEKASLEDSEYVEVLDYLVKRIDSSVAQVLKHYQEDYPLSVRLLRFRGIYLAQTGQLSSAANLLERYLTVVPSDHEIKSILLRIYLKSNNRIQLVRAKSLLFELLDSGSRYELYAFIRLLQNGEKLVILEGELDVMLGKLKEKTFYSELSSSSKIDFLRSLYRYLRFKNVDEYVRVAVTVAEHEDASVLDQYECISSLLIQGDIDAAKERMERFEKANDMEDEVGLALKAFYLLKTEEFELAYQQLETLVSNFEKSRLAFSILKTALFSEYKLPASIELSYVDLLLVYDQYLSTREMQMLYSRLLSVYPLKKLELMAELRDQPNISQEDYALWLFENGLYADVVSYLDERDSLTDSALISILAESFIYLGDFDRAKLFLDEKREYLLGTAYYFTRSRLAFLSGEAVKAIKDWDYLFSLSQESIAVEDILRLARLSAKWGDLDRSYLAYTYLQSMNAIPSPQDLLIYARAFFNKREVSDTLELYTWGTERWDDMRIKSEKMYLEMLINRDSYESESRLEDLLDEYPNVREFRVYLALAYLLGNKEGEALRLLDVAEFDWEEEAQRYLWIYASTLAMNHGDRVAQPIVSLVKKDKLKAEERILMNQFVKR